MDKKKAIDLIEKRIKDEPEFKKKYESFIANHKKEGTLSDSELNNVNGGFFGIKLCPQCGEHALTTVTFGVYAFCTECDYSEWFSA